MVLYIPENIFSLILQLYSNLLHLNFAFEVKFKHGKIIPKKQDQIQNTCLNYVLK